MFQFVDYHAIFFKPIDISLTLKFYVTSEIKRNHL